MKYLILSLTVLLTIYSNAQVVSSSNKILVTYEHIVGKYTFPKSFVYKFDTELLVDEKKAQYVHDRKEKIVRNKNYQVKISPYQYTHTHIFINDSVLEKRRIKNKTLIGQWKKSFKWEIDENYSETILGYRVKKASTKSIEMEESDPAYYGKAIAYYTTDIPIKSGPGRYGGLPGLILKLEFENHSGSYTVKSIQIQDVVKEFNENMKGIKIDEKLDLILVNHKNPFLIENL